jgi:hypothetical protein
MSVTKRREEKLRRLMCVFSPSTHEIACELACQNSMRASLTISLDTSSKEPDLFEAYSECRSATCLPWLLRSTDLQIRDG